MHPYTRWHSIRDGQIIKIQTNIISSYHILFFPVGMIHKLEGSLHTFFRVPLKSVFASHRLHVTMTTYYPNSASLTSKRSVWIIHLTRQWILLFSHIAPGSLMSCCVDGQVCPHLPGLDNMFWQFGEHWRKAGFCKLKRRWSKWWDSLASSLHVGQMRSAWAFWNKYGWTKHYSCIPSVCLIPSMG